MKKYVKILYYAALAALLAGCGASQPVSETSPPETGAAIQSETGGLNSGMMQTDESAVPIETANGSEKLLADYVESGQWLSDYHEQSDGFYDSELEITASKIFDFDGDGISELWLEAYENSVMWGWGITGFYTVLDGEVTTVLSGEVSGGSIGGDRVVTSYDALLERHVLGKIGTVGGFGGQNTYSFYYDYAEGALTELTSFEATVYWDEDEYECVVNENEASLEQYVAMESRFTEPVDEHFILPGN